jgi:hypothetical protein
MRETDNLEQDFESCYGAEFSTDLWETTPAEFLKLLKQKVSASLSEC